MTGVSWGIKGRGSKKEIEIGKIDNTEINDWSRIWAFPFSLLLLSPPPPTQHPLFAPAKQAFRFDLYFNSLILLNKQNFLRHDKRSFLWTVSCPNDFVRSNLKQKWPFFKSLILPQGRSDIPHQHRPQGFVDCPIPLACENSRFSSLFAAGNVRSEEKRLFSNARVRAAPKKSSQSPPACSQKSTFFKSLIL